MRVKELIVYLTELNRPDMLVYVRDSEDGLAELSNPNGETPLYTHNGIISIVELTNVY